ncbi:hypothetical protein [Polaribacter sp. IC073]|uniref:hypothetical protein n=1 Tax=Polaribacter sp. IC073 TaxID=2508540 RepID=UPI0011BF9B1D|nr:hypothetical protein [Polaribacter sp. IC073]TXD48686.1 hypothetical protein ES045_05520 [Polaribacter sp. IC073]
MKRIIILICFAIFYGCSSNDDSISQNLNLIKPPDWIQGTWLAADTSISLGFKFSNDDFCSVILTGQSCFKEQLNQLFNAGLTTNVKEETINTSYSIEITLGNQIVSYEFEKVSETEIEWINDPLGDLVETIYLKQ